MSQPLTQPAAGGATPEGLYGTYPYSNYRIAMNDVLKQLPPEKSNEVAAAVERFRDVAKQLPADNDGVRKLYKACESILTEVLGDPKKAKETAKVAATQDLVAKMRRDQAQAQARKQAAAAASAQPAAPAQQPQQELPQQQQAPPQPQYQHRSPSPMNMTIMQPGMQHYANMNQQHLIHQMQMQNLGVLPSPPGLHINVPHTEQAIMTGVAAAAATEAAAAKPRRASKKTASASNLAAAAAADDGAGATAATGGGAAKGGGARRGGGAKRKKQDGEEGGKFDEAELYVGIEADDLAYEAETNNAMVAVLQRQKHGQQTEVDREELHPLSDWRLAHEVLRQRRDRAGGASAAAAAAAAAQQAVGGFMDPGFDSDVLRALQLGFSALAGSVLRRAEAAARHRVAAAQRPAEFVAVHDTRRGLGVIKRREEAVAEAKAAAEREALLKAAGSKRADEETRALAQKAKAEMVGQQQAAAANKALAATLGGKHAKWATAASGVGTKRKAGSTSTDTDAKAAAEKNPDASVAVTNDGADVAATLPTSRSRATLAGASGGADGGVPGPSAAGPGDGAQVTLDDVIVALEQDPVYCRSSLLYRLVNGMAG